ncbi:MAG: hypothetical protein AAFO07_08405 [Bacteroidota bacterium]
MLQHEKIIIPPLLLLVSSFIQLFQFSATQVEEKSTPDRYTHITDTKARDIILRSIEHGGGIERWEKIKSLSYTKNFSLLLENGAVEKAYEQVHNYTYHPSNIDIISIENGGTIHTTYTYNHYARTVNNSTTDVSQEALAKAVNTSTYVVGMPLNFWIREL